MRKLSYTLLLTAPFTAMAQDATAEIKPEPPAWWEVNIEQNLLMLSVIILAVLILFACIVILKAVRVMEKEIFNPTLFPEGEPDRILEYEEWLALEKAKPGIWTKLLGLKPLEEETDLMMEHQFDGITELDNPTPRWFMYLFYGSIIFAAGYLLNYHVLGYGKLQDEEYAIEMQMADSAKKVFLAGSANNVDENSVEPSKKPEDLASGKAVFLTNCVACHGDHGQGMVGPNLTDEYWLHGGKVNNVFKTIKYGVPEKGMISWEKQLTPKQIAEVANYILSLQGSKPAGAKAPQGDKG